MVSPLISLIQDQILNLEAKNVTAMTVSSGVTEKQRREVFNDLNSPQPRCKLFYITPEMLMRSHAFQGILERLVSRDMVARYPIVLFIFSFNQPTNRTKIDLLSMRHIV